MQDHGGAPHFFHIIGVSLAHGLLEEDDGLLEEDGVDELEEDVVWELDDGVEVAVVLFPSVCVFVGCTGLEQLPPFPAVSA